MAEDEARSPAEGAETTATATEADVKAAVRTLLDHSSQWVYDDNPPHTYCPSCLWDSRKDQRKHVDGLGHRPGCELEAAFKLLEAFAG